jgi:hypothetical protein
MRAGGDSNGRLLAYTSTIPRRESGRRHSRAVYLMSSLFKAPTVNIPPAPAPLPPPTMPDPFSPSAMNAAKVQAAARAGRSSTMLTQAARGGGTGTLAGGAGVPYSGRTLGGGG